MKEIIISDKNGVPVANSLEVAENFDKGHNHVIRDIEKIKKGLSKFGYTPEMFFETTYQHPQNKQFYKCYEMTRDGFMLLTMGFSGQKALAWKLKYIHAFNEMENEIKRLTFAKEYGRIELERMFSQEEMKNFARASEEIHNCNNALNRIDYSITQLSGVVKCFLQENFKKSTKRGNFMQDYTLDTLKSCLPQYLSTITKHRRGKQYNCPFCGSGTGKNGTPALSTYEDDTQWKCFSCGAGGDIIDLFLMHNNLVNSPDNFKYAVKTLSEMFHIGAVLPELPRQTGTRTHVYTTDTGKPFAMKTITSMSDGSKKCYWNLFDPSTQQFSVSGLQKQTAPLYQVHQLARTKGTVFFTEGEKDAELLMKWGCTATCTPNGAGQATWHEDYSRYLRNRDIIILTDNDKAGEHYGRFIGKHVYQTAKSVKVVPASAIYALCPQKGDISDIANILGEDKAKQALKTAVGETKSYQPEEELPENPDKLNYSVICADDVEETPVEFLWFPYIPVGEITIMYASGGTGKSFLTCGIAGAVTSGWTLPHPDEEPKQVKPENVIFISAEDNANILKQRLKQAGADTSRCFFIAPPTNPQELAKYQPFELPRDGQDIARIEALRTLIKTYSAKLVILDPWSAYIGREKDMNKANDVRAITAVLSVIAKEFHCAFLIVAHTNKKPQADNANDAVSGSVDLVNGARSALAVRTFGNTDKRIMIQTKCNYSEMGKSVCYQIINQGRGKTAKFEWAGFSDITKEDLETTARTGKKLSDVADEKADKAEQQKMAIETIIRLSEFGKKTPISFQRFREELISDYGEDFLPSRPASFFNSLISDLRTRGIMLENVGKNVKSKLPDGKTDPSPKYGFFICHMTDSHLMAEAMPKK